MEKTVNFSQSKGIFRHLHTKWDQNNFAKNLNIIIKRIGPAFKFIFDGWGHRHIMPEQAKKEISEFFEAAEKIRAARGEYDYNKEQMEQLYVLIMNFRVDMIKWRGKLDVDLKVIP